MGARRGKVGGRRSDSLHRRARRLLAAGRRRERTSTILISAATAVAITAGVSYAATGGLSGKQAHASSGEMLYACVSGRFGTLHRATAGAPCPFGEEKISWRATGATGPP